MCGLTNPISEAGPNRGFLPSGGSRTCRKLLVKTDSIFIDFFENAWRRVAGNPAVFAPWANGPACSSVSKQNKEEEDNRLSRLARVLQPERVII